jgi:toxin CcdB
VAAQYDLFQMLDGQMLLVVQADLLDGMRTRVVAPLLPAGPQVTPLRHFNPVFDLGQGAFVLMPQLMATLTVAQLGRRGGSLSAFRDEIIRALAVV